MIRKQNYPAIMNMIKAYEHKYKKQMMYITLLDYIQQAYKFSRATTKEYGEDLRHMNYITVQADGKVIRMAGRN